SPDGSAIATGGGDGAVRIWDAKTGAEIRALAGPGGAILRVAFNGDESLVVAGQKGWFTVWDLARPRGARAMLPRLRVGLQALNDRPADAGSLACLGEWYALRGVPTVAADLLSRAASRGYEVPHLTLARCYWRIGKLAAASGEFAAAQRADGAPLEYLAA